MTDQASSLQPADAATQPALPAGAADCHTHLIRLDLPRSDAGHSLPQHDFLLHDYLSLLDTHGVTYGLLTPPSFYGTDNTLLLESLDAAGGRLLGTVEAAPTTDVATLASLRRRGVVGVRLNWASRQGKTLPDVSQASYRNLFACLRALDMHIELHLEGERHSEVLQPILDSGVKLVFDHFGRPEPVAGVQGDGFQSILRLVQEGRAWVKLSAPFRLRGAPAQPYVDALLQAGSGAGLIWATDCPWVGFENDVSYRQCIDWLREWVPDASMQQRILVDTPRSLFGFA